MTIRRPLTFSVYSADGALLRTEELDPEIIKIGRLASCHLLLDDESVARLHAVIEATDEGATIIDLGGAAGTIVNGRKVNKAALQDGDEVVLGATRIVVGGAGAPVQRSLEAVPEKDRPPVAMQPCCPRCRQPLVPRAIPGAAQAGVGLCQPCGGLWLDRTILGQATQLPGVATALREIAEDSALRAPLGGLGGILNVACPICRTLMERCKHGRTGIVIDLCQEHGVWFDRGELRRTLDRTPAPGGPFRSAPPPTERPERRAPAWIRAREAPRSASTPLLLQLADLLLDLGF